MGDRLFKVLKPGLFTTVQDLGRTGYQQYGMVVSGAMDAFALQVGNILVGNERGKAALEMTVMGPELYVLQDTVVAICGADLSPMLDQTAVPLWKSFRVRKGQTLRFGEPKSGARAYLTVAGGIDVPTVMGSTSTYVKARIGGVQGRELQSGDMLKGEQPPHYGKHLVGRGLYPAEIPQYSSSQRLRMILGPDHKCFHEESINTFFSQPYRVSTQSDRMGYRLQGPKLEHVAGADILSDAIFPGTIQVPSGGEPIILLADRQTTGGYTRIGTVISVDLPYLAQMMPGHRLCFQAIRVEEAQQLYVRQEQLLRKLSIRAGVFSSH